MRRFKASALKWSPNIRKCMIYTFMADGLSVGCWIGIPEYFLLVWWRVLSIVIAIVFNGQNLLAFKLKPIIQNEINIKHNLKNNIPFNTMFHSSLRVVSMGVMWVCSTFLLQFKLNLRLESREFLLIYWVYFQTNS